MIEIKFFSAINFDIVLFSFKTIFFGRVVLLFLNNDEQKYRASLVGQWVKADVGIKNGWGSIEFNRDSNRDSRTLSVDFYHAEWKDIPRWSNIDNELHSSSLSQ